MTEIPLAQAIAGLRSELQKAISAGAGEPLRFELESVDLELQVAITTKGSTDAKVGLWSVLTAGVAAERSRGSVHKLTLKLSPRLADQASGDKVLVGDELDELPPPAQPED